MQTQVLHGDGWLQNTECLVRKPRATYAYKKLIIAVVGGSLHIYRQKIPDILLILLVVFSMPRNCINRTLMIRWFPHHWSANTHVYWTKAETQISMFNLFVVNNHGSKHFIIPKETTAKVLNSNIWTSLIDCASYNRPTDKIVIEATQIVIT